MFYEQSNEYITWRKLGHSCIRAFVYGIMLGVMLIACLALYWYGWRAASVMTVQQFVPGLTQAQQEWADRQGPHTVETSLSGLDYHVRSTFYRLPQKVECRENLALGVAVGILLAAGSLAALLMFVVSIGRVRWREPAAVRRARHTIEKT